jgi:hypothetical protein
MDGLSSNVSKHIKQQAVIKFLTHKNEIPIKVHQLLFAYCGEATGT